MDSLLLIRHSLPDIKPEIPASEWMLSPVGRERCNSLTGLLKSYTPMKVVTSTEMKAFQTGAILAKSLDMPVSTFENLHEHKRDPNDYEDQVGFEQCMSEFFSHPNELIFGNETAQQALERFSGALESVMSLYPDGNIAVVTHGTVLALWSARLTGEEPYSFWKKLGMPALLVFSRPELKLLELINHVE
jgi:broad specificity phosphatase PhoE